MSTLPLAGKPTPAQHAQRPIDRPGGQSVFESMPVQRPGQREDRAIEPLCGERRGIKRQHHEYVAGARVAERKQPSLVLRLRTPYFYPTPLYLHDTSTLQRAWASTCLVTLPSNSSSVMPAPCLPSTIRSAPCSFSCSRTRGAASPSVETGRQLPATIGHRPQLVGGGRELPGGPLRIPRKMDRRSTRNWTVSPRHRV